MAISTPTIYRLVVTLWVVVCLGGCRSDPAVDFGHPGRGLATWPEVSAEQTLAFMRQRDAALTAWRGQGTLELFEPGRSIRLDAIVLADMNHEPSPRLRIRASKLGRTVMDIVQTSEGFWVWQSGRARNENEGENQNISEDKNTCENKNTSEDKNTCEDENTSEDERKSKNQSKRQNKTRDNKEYKEESETEDNTKIGPPSLVTLPLHRLPYERLRLLRTETDYFVMNWNPREDQPDQTVKVWLHRPTRTLHRIELTPLEGTIEIRLHHRPGAIAPRVDKSQEDKLREDKPREDKPQVNKPWVDTPWVDAVRVAEHKGRRIELRLKTLEANPVFTEAHFRPMPGGRRLGSAGGSNPLARDRP